MTRGGHLVIGATCGDSRSLAPIPRYATRLGPVDRLWTLTSKDDGSFEFEVLSLREYFAAGFLYRSVGEDTKGFDRIDVFREILRRPYWLNTARFCGGNAEVGEVSVLAGGVFDELAEDRYGQGSSDAHVSRARYSMAPPRTELSLRTGPGSARPPLYDPDMNDERLLTAEERHMLGNCYRRSTTRS
jgi:hypothetical protein